MLKQELVSEIYSRFSRSCCASALGARKCGCPMRGIAGSMYLKSKNVRDEGEVSKIIN